MLHYDELGGDTHGRDDISSVDRKLDQLWLETDQRAWAMTVKVKWTNGIRYVLTN
jgi:hypothetical protein